MMTKECQLIAMGQKDEYCDRPCEICGWFVPVETCIEKMESLISESIKPDHHKYLGNQTVKLDNRELRVLRHNLKELKS